MPITPLDIIHQEFKRVFRGYDERQVREFLDQASKAFETLVNEHARLKESNEHLLQRVGQYEKLEDSMQKALVLAEKMAEETKGTAEKRAEVILLEAEQQANRIVEGGQQKAQQVELGIKELHQQRERFREEFRSLLESHLRILLTGSEGKG